MKYVLLFSIFTAILFEACNTPIKVPVVSEDSFTKDSVLQVRKNFPFLEKYTFEAYNTVMLKGAPAAPDFLNNQYSGDPDYVSFIVEGCKGGVNFGGHYTIIEKSCGAMCSHLFMVDRRDGKIFFGTMGLKEEDGYYGLTYRANSNLLITDSSVLADLSIGESNKFSMTPQVFEWKNDTFVLLE